MRGANVHTTKPGASPQRRLRKLIVRDDLVPVRRAALRILQERYPESGDAVENPQQAINERFDAAGVEGEGETTRKAFSSNNVI